MRGLVLIGFILLVNYGVRQLLEMVKTTGTGDAQTILTGVIIASLLLYTILMAVPFVPGVEIGLSLLMIQGATVAPYVFLATFTGLTISFLIGHYLPASVLRKALEDLGFNRASALIARIEPLGREQRLALIRRRLPAWMAKTVVRYRYLTIAIALNIPGNSIIGGGGGIALITGFSGLFSPVATMITFALAVSPVALAVYYFGTGFLG